MLHLLKPLMIGSFLFSLTYFHPLMAEQGAWGGNGGWWGGGNREWEGDFDGPGYYHRSSCYDYSCYHVPHNHYNSHHYSNCHQRCYLEPSEYYYDESVPGAGLYFNVRYR